MRKEMVGLLVVCLLPCLVKPAAGVLGTAFTVVGALAGVASVYYDGGSDGGVYIVNKHDFACLDFGEWSFKEWRLKHFHLTKVAGPAVVNRQCHGEKWQRFKVDGPLLRGMEDPDGHGGPGGLIPGDAYVEPQCLDLVVSSGDVIHYECHGHDNQKWDGRIVGDSVQIVSVHKDYRGKCLTRLTHLKQLRVEDCREGDRTQLWGID